MQGETKVPAIIFCLTSVIGLIMLFSRDAHMRVIAAILMGISMYNLEQYWIVTRKRKIKHKKNRWLAINGYKAPK